MHALRPKWGWAALTVAVLLTGRAVVAKDPAPTFLPKETPSVLPPGTQISPPLLPPIPNAPDGDPPRESLPPATRPAVEKPAVELPTVPKGRPVSDLVIDANDGTTPNNPTGRQEPGISLEWLTPANVRIGVPATCTLIVKSLSTNRLHHVVVRGKAPAGAQVKGTEPKAESEGELLVWNIGTLEPRMERRLDLNMVPKMRGSLTCSAFVTFTGSSTARLEVREPKILIKAASPPKVHAGDLATFPLTVSNPGDARAEQVHIKVQLSDGLEYSMGHTAEFNLENLGPGESRTVLVQCVAKTAGTQQCAAIVTAEPGLESSSKVAVEVVAPKLDLAVGGPKMRYLDRHAVYTFKVSNPGTAAALNVTLANQVPAGFKVVSTTEGGAHDFSTGSVMWYLGDLKPGQEKEVALDLLAINPGEFRLQSTVSAARGVKAKAELFTRVEGLPGLQMELVDVEDPIEVNKEISYEIRLTNTGTRTETNLQLTCTLPEHAEFGGAKCTAVGAQYRKQGREVVFAAIPKLAPRADVIYRVNLRGLPPGDHRFLARVRADGLGSPVTREESTRVFGDDREPSPAPAIVPTGGSSK